MAVVDDNGLGIMNQDVRIWVSVRSGGVQNDLAEGLMWIHILRRQFAYPDELRHGKLKVQIGQVIGQPMCATKGFIGFGARQEYPG